MRASSPVLPCLVVLLCAACGDADNDPDDTPVAESMVGRAALRQRAALSFEALTPPTLPEGQSERVLFELGRSLFFDARLSADGQVSCGSCHLSERGGADGLALAVGVSGRKNDRNAPTVFNASLQTSQHWRGDRSSLADQAARAPLGMASFGNLDEAEAIGRLSDDPLYRLAFEESFPDTEQPLSLANLGTAIAAFEATLLTPGRFDDFLSGDDGALDARELAGLELFLDVGCADCHAGVGLGGEQLRKFGVLQPYEQATGSATIDQGRFDVTQLEEDRFVFKVPMLRNVAETAPYFHDGNVIGLPQAVRVMLEVQLGERLQDYEVDNLVAFLGALSGPAPAHYIAPE